MKEKFLNLNIAFRFFLTFSIFLGSSVPRSVQAANEQNLVPESSASIIVENMGQFNPLARFLVQGEKGNIWLTQDSIWITVYEAETDSSFADSKLPLSENTSRGVHLKLSFDGANPTPHLEAFNPSKTKLSYLIGADRDQWVTNVPVYEGVRYHNLYPGIDLVIGGGAHANSQAFIPWVLEAETGSDLDAVKLRIEGVGQIEHTSGSLHLTTDVGPLDLTLPLLVNEEMQADLLSKPKPSKITTSLDQALISSPFALTNEIAAPTSTSDLDDLRYSTFLGGSQADSGSDIVVDNNGFAYTIGNTSSANFPTTPGAFDTNLSLMDVFVAKLAPDGSDLIYATYIGGGNIDKGFGIAVNNGIAYLTGTTYSIDFPLVPDQLNGLTDAFVAALNSTGTDLLYVTLVGGSYEEYGYGIDTDGDEAYVTGTTLSRDFPASGYKGEGDAFVIKVGSNGSLSYALLLSGSLEDDGFAISVLSGEAYITGKTASIDFLNLFFNYSGGFDAFIVKLNTTGGVAFADFHGGVGDDVGSGIFVDINGNSYIAGSTDSVDFPATIGSYQGGGDGFLTLFNSSGSMLEAVYLGGSGTDDALGVGIDYQKDVYLNGRTYSSDFPTTSEAFQPNLAGESDGFIMRLDLDNTEPIRYSSYLGGADPDQANALAVDANAYAFIIGQTQSITFPVTLGSFDLTLGGFQDSFVTKFAAGPIPELTIEKKTNNFDADQQPGPFILKGSLVDWTYTVTNTGRVTITEVTVNDSEAITLNCPPQTSLTVGDSITCTASGLAVTGQYTNTGYTTGSAPDPLAPPSDSDLSHYFGASPAITITKLTNGADGSEILVGSPITWTYQVTNNGNVPIMVLDLSDNQPGVIPAYHDGDLNDDQVFDVGETWIYTATGVSTIGSYSNIVDASAVYTDDLGASVNIYASDSSSYFGASPGIGIEKTTNGQDGDFILVDDPITWHYTVTNTGNVPLMTIGLSDSDPLVTPALLSGDQNANDLLDIDETWVYAAYATAEAGAYSNTGTVNADYSDDHGSQTSVDAADQSNYFGTDPHISLHKRINDQHASAAPGPLILVDSPVTWTYQITNTGNITLTDITLSDDPLGPITCTKNSLAVNESMTCTQEGLAVEGQYANTATVQGNPPVGPAVTDGDSSFYFGVAPAISLFKATNGEEGSTLPGPLIQASDPVSWTYQITNTGNYTLTGISLSDDPIGTITCPLSSLAANETMICLTEGIATAGQYTNTASVTGIPPVGIPVIDSAISHYYGVVSGMALVKLTNGMDAKTPPGPYILVGETVTWTFNISNTGNYTLTEISLLDDDLGEINTCPSTHLGADEGMSCIVTGTAESDQYVNSAVVSGTPPVGETVSSNDVSHFFGTRPELQINKFTNGEDVPQAPGPYIPDHEKVSWSYEVTNTGNITLTNVVVSDDQGVNVTCPQDVLGAGEKIVCSANDRSEIGQYTNLGQVIGESPAGPTDSVDRSFYFGYDTNESISIEVVVNGEDADIPPGAYLMANQTITWTYSVYNISSVGLYTITISDDHGTPSNPGDDIQVCTISSLDSFSLASCQRTEVSIIGQFSSNATTNAYLSDGSTIVSDTDPTHYFGVIPGFGVEKRTQGQDADLSPGPIILSGMPVTWTYTVTNATNITLSDIALQDDMQGQISCPESSLAPGEWMQCQAGDIADKDQYTNLATIYGKPPGNLFPFYDTDPSHYFGADPKIAIEKTTNGRDGAFVLVGEPVTWTYTVTNAGNLPLTTVIITDSDSSISPILVGGDSNEDGNLDIDEAWIYSAIGFAEVGPYNNTGWASAFFEDDFGNQAAVDSSDASDYFGVEPQISIHKKTNGEAGDTLPGPVIQVGEPITWTYQIMNTGNYTLTNITVFDDMEGEVMLKVNTQTPPLQPVPILPGQLFHLRIPAITLAQIPPSASRSTPTD